MTIPYYARERCKNKDCQREEFQRVLKRTGKLILKCFRCNNEVDVKLDHFDKGDENETKKR